MATTSATRMIGLTVTQISDRAALDAFQATKGDDQLGFVRLNTGAYAVMNRHSVWNAHSDRNVVSLAAVVDSAAVLSALLKLYGFIADEENRQNGYKKSRSPDAAPRQVCGVLSGLCSMEAWEADLFGDRLASGPVEPQARRFETTPLEVARPWRAAYRNRVGWFGQTTRQAKLELLGAARDFWAGEYARLRAEISGPAIRVRRSQA
jgi:hypothetical protein